MRKGGEHKKSKRVGREGVERGGRGNSKRRNDKKEGKGKTQPQEL